MEYERITCDDVRVGDRIGRTRGSHFPEVIAINEGEVSRRIALEWLADDCPEWLTPEEGRVRGYDAGNIRPRRDAKLWRLVDPGEGVDNPGVPEPETVNVEPNWDGVRAFVRNLHRTDPAAARKVAASMGSEAPDLDE